MLPKRLRRLPRHTIGSGLTILEARSPWARLLGLALLPDLPQDHALLIPRCRSVHTFGMRFALDITFLDAHGRPLRTECNVGPCRVLGDRRADAVLEARAVSAT